jgi:hypothetical protein
MNQTNRNFNFSPAFSVENHCLQAGFPFFYSRKIVWFDMRLLGFFISVFLMCAGNHLAAQDYIERDYFPNARAKNAAIAAARYAEEGYYYSKFSSYISTVDSSRVFLDTALFYIKRSEMLCDTSLFHAPPTNYPAVDFLRSGRTKIFAADSIIREFYPMVEIKSHNIFGAEASLQMSNAVMEFFNASLLLSGDKEDEPNPYPVLPYDDEVIRLELDEIAFQQSANEFQEEIEMLEGLSTKVASKISAANDQKSRFLYRERLDELNAQIDQSTSRLKDVSGRIEEIRQLLNNKYLEDVKGVEQPEHLSQFETESNEKELLMDEEVPQGLVYKIQLGYYPSDVDLDNFHGLFPITGETVRKDLMRVYAGLFYSYADASEGNKYIRENAIANAFVVPFHNGRKIGISRAVEIEKARGVK